MALLKGFFPLATLFAVAFASPFAEVYFLYSTVSLSATEILYRAHKFCSEHNSTDEEKYRGIVWDAVKCSSKGFQSNDSICHNFEINVQKCSQPLVDHLVDCLPEKSKDFPPALVKVFTSLAETFCNSSGEILLETMNECLFEFIKQNKTVKVECKKETFQAKLNKYLKEMPSKSEACQFVREVGDCWKEHVDEDCKNSKVKELFSKFYNATLSPCNNNEVL